MPKKPLNRGKYYLKGKNPFALPDPRMAVQIKNSFSKKVMFPRRNSLRKKITFRFKKNAIFYRGIKFYIIFANAKYRKCGVSTIITDTNKMKIKLVLPALLLAVMAVNIQAQNDDSLQAAKNRKLKNFIGIGAGFTTGVGISYRFVPGKVGFQATVGPYYMDYGNDAFISCGLTLLKKIAESKYNNLYLYLGNHYIYRSYKDYNHNYYSSDETFTEEIWNTGVGLDFEFVSTKKVVMNIMLGYMQFNSFESLLPTIDAALYYKF